MAKKIVKEEIRTVDKETGEVIVTPAILMEEDAANYNTVDGYEPIHWKTPWNHDTNAESDRTGLACKDETRTQQHLAADQDINNILAKFLRTGEPPTMIGTPVYQDALEPFDLQDTMITQHQVLEAWDKLPLGAKELLGDPARFNTYVETALARGDRAALERVDLVKPRAPETLTPPGGTPAPGPASGASDAPQNPPAGG